MPRTAPIHEPSDQHHDGALFADDGRAFPDPAHQAARVTFDLEKAIAGLPAASPPPRSPKGCAGWRLRGDLRTDIPEKLLRELARDALGAKRMSDQYLEALRIVLGNQAHAEATGRILEMNVRNDFTTERVMRTILDQINGAQITRRVRVCFGPGRVQQVQIYGQERSVYIGSDDEAAEMLAAMDREQEAKDDARRARDLELQAEPTSLTSQSKRSRGFPEDLDRQEIDRGDDHRFLRAVVVPAALGGGGARSSTVEPASSAVPPAMPKYSSSSFATALA